VFHRPLSAALSIATYPGSEGVGCHHVDPSLPDASISLFFLISSFSYRFIYPFQIPRLPEELQANLKELVAGFGSLVLPIFVSALKICFQ
jgi:hypothetical protein